MNVHQPHVPLPYDLPPEYEALRVPPHSLHAEQAVIGGLMLWNEAWESIGDQLTAGDFFRLEHRVLFEAIAELAAVGEPFDAVTIHERLSKTQHLDDAGGSAYIGTLSQSTPSAANIAAYAEIVRERSVMRQLIQVGTEIANSGYVSGGQSVAEMIDAAEARLSSVANSMSRKHRAVIGAEKVGGVLEAIDKQYHSGDQLSGLSTGFTDLDRKTAGLNPGDLVLVGGRPSMGKSAFAECIADHLTVDLGHSVMFFSLEMPVESLLKRQLASRGRIPLHALRAPSPRTMGDAEWRALSKASGVIANASGRFLIDDEAQITVEEIRSRARQAHREHGISLVVVDYLQEVDPPKAERHDLAIGHVARQLKKLAKELHIPVVALAQLNRSLEQRPNKRPMMSDLRESGALEQAADLILFIYRDEVYHPDSPRAGVAEVIIGKQRNGELGTVPLTYLGQHTRFENYIGELPDCPPPARGPVKSRGFSYDPSQDEE